MDLKKYSITFNADKGGNFNLNRLRRAWRRAQIGMHFLNKADK